MSKGPSIQTSEIKIKRNLNTNIERRGTYSVTRSAAIRGVLSPKSTKKVLTINNNPIRNQLQGDF